MRAIRAAAGATRRSKFATARSPRPARSAIGRLFHRVDRGVGNADSRFEASLALAALPDIRALQVYLRGLTDKSTELRKASAAAIGNIRDQAAVVLDQLAARHELPPEAMPELRSIYTGLVPVTKWHVLGPFAFDPPPDFHVEKPIDLKATWNGFEGRRVSWRAAEAVDSRGQIDLGRIFLDDDDRAAYAFADHSRAHPSGKPRWSSARTTR